MLYLSLATSAVGLGLLWSFMRRPEGGPPIYLAFGLPWTIFFAVICPAPTECVALSMMIAITGAVVWHRGGRRAYRIAPLLLSALAVGHIVPSAVRSFGASSAPPPERKYPPRRWEDDYRPLMAAFNPRERLPWPAKSAIEAELVKGSQSDLEGWIVVARQKTNRDGSFSELHDRLVGTFVNRPGQGQQRMRRFPDKEYFFPTREPIPQPERISTSQVHEAIEHPIELPDFDPSQRHRRSVLEFAFPFGWGWERGPNEIYGFQRHQFGKHSKNETRQIGDWSPGAEQGWRIASLELIGLLAHPKPTVYMTENLPRMDEAKAAPTRDPDEFETAGLKALAGGKELYFGRSRTEPLLRMVGGLRAAKSCTACHGCREGELLGAFSYTLVK